MQILLLILGCTINLPASPTSATPATTPAAAPAAVPAAAPVAVPVAMPSPAAAQPMPVGKWYYDVREPGIEYELDVQATWAKFSAEGVQTSIYVEGQLQPNATGGWDYVVTRDAGSMMPYAVGTRLFKVKWIGSDIVGENTEASVFETMGGMIAPFTRNPPAAAKMGACKGNRWKCDGQSAVHCEGGSWTIKETCDPEHICVANSSGATCYDKGQR